MKRARQSWADVLEAAGATSHGVNLAALTGEPLAARSKLDVPTLSGAALTGEPRVKARAGKASQIELPLPPTTNNLFINVRGRGRVPSPKYREWKAIAALAFARMEPVRVFPVAVHITVCGGKGFRKGSDICNREKGLLDAAVEAKILPDDSWDYVQRVIIEYRPAGSKSDIAKAVVRIDPL